MYWYYKYPIIIVLVALLFGTGVYIWRSKVSAYLQRKRETVVNLSEKETEKNAAKPVSSGESSQDKEKGKTENEAKAANSSAVTLKQSALPDIIPQNVEEALKQAQAALKDDNPKAARELAYSVLKEEYCRKYDSSWYALASIINEANSIFMNGRLLALKRTPISSSRGITSRK